jgi:hypothetical protein
VLKFIVRHWFALVVAGYVAYALAFIYNSSIIVNGQRYFVLLDDAMISMTYARNLALGHGAVWYPGYDPVQGYSNPLWMLFMALVHCLPLPPSIASLPVQLMGIPLIVGTLVFVKKIAERLAIEDVPVTTPGPKNRPAPGPPLSSRIAPVFAVLLTAFYFPLNNWALRGMEVGAVAFGVALAVWGALRCADRKAYGWWLFLLLGVLTTVRMDAIVAGVVIWLWLWWTLPERRIFTLVWGAGSLAFFIFGQMIFQKLYYHEWLPNTYYLKLENIRLDRRIVWGAYVLFHFCAGFGLWLLMAAALYAAGQRSKTVVLLVSIIAGQVAYSVYVGGDAWEWMGGANRFLCVAIPMLFILLAASLVKLRDLLTGPLGKVSPQAATAAAVVMGVLALVEVNSYQFQAGSSLAQCLLLDKPPEWKGFWDVLEAALNLRNITTPRARIAVIWAGIIPYFSERPPIDLLGKNDRQIAHGPEKTFEPPPLPFFTAAPVSYCWPGHSKRDYHHSIVELRPDVVCGWYGMQEPEITNFLIQNYAPAQAGSLILHLDKSSKEIDFSGLPTKQ